MDTSIPPNLDEYSASATTVKFDRPIPLLRGPIPSGSKDDPSSGRYVLAFKTPESWAAAYRSCKSKIIEQCEGGTRIGCAISASHKCKPPWWSAIIGLRKPEDLKERERCEEREMAACLAAAEGKCAGFAKEKLARPFKEARIASTERTMPVEEMRKMVSFVSAPESEFERKIWRKRFQAVYDKLSPAIRRMWEI
ncbi:uncharacterized protein LOC120010140 isoform X1 [Tripterygium wilfordii]|uniref:uncharacterized protein LOC120010140 isoform X1 n=1 Tax=Tripterygium wilfordii TaxID=458696 RepID=UPI0018F82431|nr:uncharacterized protein LOC120010140 isoform X1 [Tripterygium wilfordii]